MNNKNPRNLNQKDNLKNSSKSQTQTQMKNVLGDIFKNNNEGYKHIKQNLFRSRHY